MLLMNHVGIIVKDSMISRRFYLEVLGLELEGIHEDERVILTFLKAGQGTIELIEKKNVEEVLPRGVVEHIAFTVENMEEKVNKLKECNVTLISGEPYIVGKKKIFFFQGPNGEKLEFVQILA